MCLRHCIKLIWESPTTKDKNLHRHLCSFPIQNSNQMASRLTATTTCPRVFFQLRQFSRQRPSFSAHRAAMMTKTDLIFPAFSSRFLNCAVQLCFLCQFLFHEERCSSQVWPGRLYVGRWNKRVRAKGCGAEDWGLLKRGDFTYLYSNFDFLNTRNSLLCELFCSEAFAKGEFFLDENRTLNFALWMSKIFSR